MMEGWWQKLTMFTDIFEQLFNFFIWQIVSEFSHDVAKIVRIDKSIFVSIESNKRVFQFYKMQRKSKGMSFFLIITSRLYFFKNLFEHPYSFQNFV